MSKVPQFLSASKSQVPAPAADPPTPAPSPAESVPGDAPAQAPNLGNRDALRIPVLADAPAKDSPFPAARLEVGRSAFERNLPVNRGPAPSIKKYRVSVNGKSDVVEAIDERDAWAIYCDAQQSYPSPRASGRVIELVS